MKPIAAAHGCSVARVALAWLLSRPVVTSVIVGARRLEQLHDNLAAVELALSEVELTDALSAHVKEKGRMPEMDHAALARDYPVLYQSMLQLIHNSGERINHLMEGREAKGEKKK